MNKNLSFKDILKKGALIYNPVLVQIVGLCPVVAASTTFVHAAALSVAMCIELFGACFAASAFLRNIPRWMRVPDYVFQNLESGSQVIRLAKNSTGVEIRFVFII